MHWSVNRPPRTFPGAEGVATVTSDETQRAAARKGVSADVRVRSTSTHKARSAWFQARESWPYREAPVDRLTATRRRVATELPPAPGTGEWQPVGPQNIGGRMTCLVAHPTEPGRIWAGAAGGGVWSSLDAGRSWRSLWHDQQSLSIGALALDPADADVLYCGTGEANLSADSYAGTGLYQSLDAGEKWQRIATADTQGGLPRRIGCLAVDPFRSGRLLAGGVVHSDGGMTGLFTSGDGGRAWTRVPIIGDSPYRCHDVRFHPGIAGLLYATISAQGMNNGIWRSTDDGTTWQHLRIGLPSPDQVVRSTLALAPSDPGVVYALMSTGGRPSRVLGPFRSTDHGDTWHSIGGTHFADERQMTYNNTIVVHPQNPSHVLCGGVDLHLTVDAGAHWRQVTHWDADRGASDYAHADHHALLMPATRPGSVYDLNDGGLDFSADGGRSWQNRSDGLATNMFYDLAVAQGNGQVIAGGAQDNGTLITRDGQPNGWQEWTGGDGGWVAIDPTDVDHIYSTAQGMIVWRHRAGDGIRRVDPPETKAVKEMIWMAVTAMDARTPTTVYIGSVRVWKSVDDGESWRPVSDALDGSAISALEVARDDSNRLYAGTENGGLFRSVDGGRTWSGNLASTVLPGTIITRLESRPDNADVLYATVATFGASHVFRSADGGLSWADVDRGALGDAPCHSLAVPAAHPERVYVCGDAGVFVSPDQGATWENLTRNLPTVMVVDIVYHETDRTLTAATYGRSIWRLRVD